MSVSSNVKIVITSMRCNKQKYEVKRFTEFNVDLDLETDADAFDLVAENPHGLYTGLFCRFDPVVLYINGKAVMHGNIDVVDYYITPTKDYIKISGRDICWKLVDNDALCKTLKNVNPKNYIKKKCKKYGIKSSISKSSTYKKLVIGCGESEISIMNDIILENKQRVWFSVDTLYSGKWGTNKKKSHQFTMGSGLTGIPIKNLEYREDGTDMKSEVVLYGSTGDGKQKISGRYKNKYMTNKKITKLETKRQYSDSSANKYKSIAQEDMRKNFRDDTEMRVVVPLDSENVYMPNTTCNITVTKLGINATFFIKKVQYLKEIDNGGEATLVCIPADSSFEKLWTSSTSITLTNFTTKSKKLAGSAANKKSADKSSTKTSTSKYFRKCSYTGCSIVDGLKSIDENSSYSYRKKIASKNKISGYTGKASQNSKMLKLLKAGKLLKP